ncbi:MAG: class I SAM-dependent methyltransferase [Candidatus Omnitrophica bacterium]|nr:class I SAM-dependent methyltransferase [Candidatus Omnitrophota bacterium]
MNSVFDRYYKRYDAWYDKYKFAYLSELETIRQVLPNEGKGLEIGVGTGRFAVPLGIAMGIDPSKNMIDIAEKRGVNVRLGSGDDLLFFEDTFDYVAIIITICFVKNPLKVLREAHRVLKSKGKLIVAIIDKDSFLGKYYYRKKSIFYKQVNFFGVKELTDLFKTAGFNRFTYCQTVFHLPDKIKSIEKPKKGFDKGGFVVISARAKLNQTLEPL